MGKRLCESGEPTNLSAAKRPEEKGVLSSSRSAKGKGGNTVEAADLLSALPAELQHKIVVWSFRCHPASVGCLAATSRVLHAAVCSAYVKIESWAHHVCVRVGILSIARLACVTGAKNETDAITGLALAVMYAYVAGSLSEKECWHERALEPGDIKVLREGGTLIERLGLPNANSASPSALVEWITSNHRALDHRAIPPLFPAIVDNVRGRCNDYFAPATMGKYRVVWPLTPQDKEILRVGGPLDRKGHVREAFSDTARLDLLFGLCEDSFETLFDLPRGITHRTTYPCTCHRRGAVCKTCRCLRAVADALDRPEMERRAIAWIDKRTTDHLPLDIASCVADCPQLRLTFGDLFCMSDMHAASSLDNVLFFGTVRPRFDVDALLRSASRLCAA